MRICLMLEAHRPCLLALLIVTNVWPVFLRIWIMNPVFQILLFHQGIYEIPKR